MSSFPPHETRLFVSYTRFFQVRCETLSQATAYKQQLIVWHSLPTNYGVDYQRSFLTASTFWVCFYLNNNHANTHLISIVPISRSIYFSNSDRFCPCCDALHLHVPYISMNSFATNSQHSSTSYPSYYRPRGPISLRLCNRDTRSFGELCVRSRSCIVIAAILGVCTNPNLRLGYSRIWGFSDLGSRRAAVGRLIFIYHVDRLGRLTFFFLSVVTYSQAGPLICMPRATND